jgi:predicted glycoside hydrolase/deacetylase ChbG (UPF0249 family)/folate-dependent phosphoribosylglycinamide formyltransferase PurN
MKRSAPARATVGEAEAGATDASQAPLPPPQPLVIHADDLGLARACNEGIREAAAHGAVTSASLFACSEGFHEAVTEVIPECPDLGLGIHLNLTDGRALRPRPGGSAIVGPDGHYRAGFVGLLTRQRDRRLLAEVEYEFRNQIEAVLEHVPRPDHLNSHQHVHAVPAIFELVCRLAREYNIPFVRIPGERFHRTDGLLDHLRLRYGVNLVKVAVLGALERRLRRIAAATGIRTNAHFIGLAYTGFMNTDRVEAGLAALDGSDEVVEVLLHPARPHSGRDETYPSSVTRDYVFDPERANELNALLDPALSQMIAARGYTPTCYGCLAGSVEHDHSPPPPPEVPSRPPLRAFAILDDDPLYHPTYLRRLLSECPDLELCAAAVVRPPGGTGPAAYMRKRLRSLRPAEVVRLGAKQLGRQAIGRLPRPLRGDRDGSVAAVLERFGVPYRVVASVNDAEFLSHLRSLKPELIVSSNSLIFGDELLKVPSVAAINRHSALLPAYGGVLPVFRAMQKSEGFCGASVHRMVAEIDRGEVLARIWVPIFAGDTLDGLYSACFSASVAATAEAARRLRAEEATAPFDDEGLEPSYYSFPGDQDWCEFRQRGGRLI